MKGLLLKDWYMMKKYCRAYLLIAAVFITVSLFGDDNLFFVFYPCLLCGIIPVNLLGYDERSRWMQYSATLPYTRTQIVSSKYLIGLLAQVAMMTVTGIVQCIKLSISGSFVLHEFAVMMLLLLTISTFTSSICLPFVFKLGVEKGRMAYYVMVGFVCCAGMLASNLISGQWEMPTYSNVYIWVFSLIGIALYIFSWYLSVVFYKKREL